MSQIQPAGSEDCGALSQYMHLFPQHFLLHVRLADYYQGGAESLRLYKKAHKLLPTDAHTIHKIAETAYFMSQYTISATFYKKLGGIRDLTPDELRKASWAAQTSKRYRQAVSYYEKLIQVAMLETSHYINLGFCYGKLGNSTKALEMSQYAYKLNPYDYIAMLNIGFRYWVLGDLKQAREFTEKALKGYHDYSFALMNMGHINWCEGDKEKAMQYYRNSRYTMKDDKKFARLMQEDSKHILTYSITQVEFDEVLDAIMQQS